MKLKAQQQGIDHLFADQARAAQAAEREVLICSLDNPTDALARTSGTWMSL